MKHLVFFLLAISGAFSLPVSPTEEKQALWERSGKFEGDIVLSPEQEQMLARNGLINSVYRWPDRTIPYKFDTSVSASVRSTVVAALQEYKKTCITVRAATRSETSYILITSHDTGCWSFVGRRDKVQTLNLQHNSEGTCLSTGTIVHEFLHAAGFYHQQSATDRDDFVTIQWNNIEPGKEHNFDSYTTSTITDFGVEYDYESIMHYGAYAFSSNGKATIVPKDPNASIGQRAGFSESDIKKLNLMYNC